MYSSSTTPMYFDSDGESDAEPGTPMWSSESEDEGSVASSTKGTHKELYSFETLTSVYDYLNPIVKKTQTLLLLGCTAKYASAPEIHRASWSKLKHEPDLFKTYTLKGDLEVVNPHVPIQVLHLKKLDVPAIFSKIKLCKGDSAAVVAALQNLAESGSMWRTKRQSTLKEAERETAPQFVVNTYAKGCAVVDVLYTASARSNSYAVLIDDDADDTIDTAINVFDMSVLKKDKHGTRAIFDVDLMKILFSSGANKVVLVNLAGIVDDPDPDEEEKETKMPPVFTEQSEELTEIPSSPSNDFDSIEAGSNGSNDAEPSAEMDQSEMGASMMELASPAGSRKSTPLNSPGSSRTSSPANSPPGSPAGSRKSTPLNSPGSSRSASPSRPASPARPESPVPMEEEVPIEEEPKVEVEEVPTTVEVEEVPTEEVPTPEGNKVEQGGKKVDSRKKHARKHINLTLKAKPAK